MNSYISAPGAYSGLPAAGEENFGAFRVHFHEFSSQNESIQYFTMRAYYMLNMHSYSKQNANFADIFQFRLFGDCLISTGTAVIMMAAESN